GTMSVRMPKSGILKPWMRSSEVSTKVSGTPTLAFTVLGVYSNRLAATLTSVPVSAASKRAAPPAALPNSSAVNNLRVMGLRLGAVGGRPVPVGLQVEQRAVGEDHDAVVGLVLLEVRRQPGELLVAELRLRIGDVVERDEVHALVVEGPVGRAKELLERLALV